MCALTRRSSPTRVHERLVAVSDEDSLEERVTQAVRLVLRAIATLTALDSRLEKSAERRSVAQGRLLELKSQTQRWILAATIVMTGLLCWMAAGQFALVRLAWKSCGQPGLAAKTRRHDISDRAFTLIGLGLSGVGYGKYVGIDCDVFNIVAHPPVGSVAISMNSKVCQLRIGSSDLGLSRLAIGDLGIASGKQRYVGRSKMARPCGRCCLGSSTIAFLKGGQFSGRTKPHSAVSRTLLAVRFNALGVASRKKAVKRRRARGHIDGRMPLSPRP